MSSLAQSFQLDTQIAALPRTSWMWTVASIMAADVAIVSFSVAVSLYLFNRVGSVSTPFLCFGLPLLLLITYSLFGGYSAALANSVDELQTTTVSSLILFTGVIGCACMLSAAAVPSLVSIGFMVLICVPLARRSVRYLCAGKAWWGYPVAVAGTAAMVGRCVERLRAEKSMLRPVVLVTESDYMSLDESCVRGLSDAEGANLFALIVVSSGIDLDAARRLFAKWQTRVPRTFLQPEDLSAHAHELRLHRCGPALLFQLNTGGRQYGMACVKRALDIALASLVILVAAPAMLLIAAAVKAASSGSVFYGHERFGKNATPFKAWKFRSMVANGDEVLRSYLADNEEARREWNDTRKLRNDPRITAIGRLLRFTSLDELPQLFNVLRGDMSLVGPRPIVTEEVGRYGDVFSLYKSVPPGLTGLWQVSGRNNTSYERRVALDEYYVRNWSVWMDLDILIRTVAVVITREGAC